MIQFVQKPAILTLKGQVPQEKMAAFAFWQGKLNEKIAACPGFVSIEFLSSRTPEKKWSVVQRFASMTEAEDWRNSESYREIVQDFKKLAGEKIIEAISDESSLSGGVTEVIIAEVCREKEKAYREWIGKIHLEEAKFPGFCGVFIQSPKEVKGKFWITLLQFDTRENLDRWLNSSKRQELLNESKTLISYLETHRIVSPYAGWFASLAKVGEIPALWKQTMIVLLVLFPIVMFEFKFLLPHLSYLNISLSTFIGNAISVSLISFPLMPLAIYFLGWWLAPHSKHCKVAVFTGTLFVLFLYLLEIWFFWSFI